MPTLVITSRREPASMRTRATNSLSILRHLSRLGSGVVVEGCDNTVHLEACIAAFTIVIDQCNCESVNITSSGSYIDPSCRWKYEVDLPPPVQKRATDNELGAALNIDRHRRDAPVAVATDSVLSRSDASGGQFECATEAYSHVNRSTAEDTIAWFCWGNMGHQFSSNGSEDVLFAWYYNLDFEADKNAPIGLGIYQPAGQPSRTCSYQLDIQTCVAQLTTAMNSCNDFKNNLTLSGSLRDDDCGWLWEFDLEPGVLPMGIGDSPVVHTIAPSKAAELSSGETKRQSDANTAVKMPISDCYQTGFQFPKADYDEGSESFCTWADGKVLPGSHQGDLMYTFWAQSGGNMHKQWFSIESQCGFTVTYAQCKQAMTALVDGCGAGTSRAGWATTDDTCTMFMLDNDPDLHRPGMAPNPPADLKRSVPKGPWFDNEADCFNTGYQFPLEAWNQGIQEFCTFVDGKVLQGDNIGQLSFTFDWRDNKNKLHQQSYNVESWCGGTMNYDDCIADTSLIVNGCAKKGKSRAGWGSTTCETWTLNNDPDHRRPG